MISPFEVYLVMQLDTVRSVLVGATIFAVIATLCVNIFAGIEFLSSKDYPDLESSKKEAANAAAAAPLGKKMFVAACIIGLLNAVTPSSKTAAAMILIPALTSKEVTEPVAAEAKELYTLAKKALANLADEPAQPEKPEAEKP